MRFVCLLAMGIALAVPSSASAATCSDYSNQADAQRAADTRDADGDGIYCEALPCPCLKPGGGGGGDSTPAPKPAPTPQPRPKPKPRKKTLVYEARITSVIDGDTVKVKAFDAPRRSYTVRLIGVDTPDPKRSDAPAECGGAQASINMALLALHSDGTGRRVTLRTDPTQDTFDRSGRLLAYVTTKDTGTNLALQQIADGWGRRYVSARRFKQYGRFSQAESRARAADRGVWSACGGTFHGPAPAVRHDGRPRALLGWSASSPPARS